LTSRSRSAAQVAALAERIATDHNHLDVCVNGIWGGEQLTGDLSPWDQPIRESDLNDGLRMLRPAIDTHLMTAHPPVPTPRDTTRWACR
jgi:hypothetical protein